MDRRVIHFFDWEALAMIAMNRSCRRRVWPGAAVGACLLIGVTVGGAAEPPVGDWEVTQRFGDRELTSTLSISRGEDGALAGRWISNRGQSELEDVKYEEGTLSFVRRISFQDRRIEMAYKARVEDGKLVGMVTTARGETRFTAVRKEPEQPTALNTDEPIRLNTVGYLPDARKVASIAAPAETFRVVSEDDGRVALSGRVTGPQINADTNEPLYRADFSALSASGTYRLEVEGVGRSPAFTIAANVYDEPFRLVTRAMYLWRCGAAVRGEHGGDVFVHEACHLNDAYLDHVGGGHVIRDGTGGWHDAGDYNKYVVNAGVTVGAMLHAWERFGDRFAGMDLMLPESGDGVPDFLDEVRWELQWLLKMQAPDGRVYHKVSTLDFGPFIPPEQERTDRFFAPWDSAATADFVAMMAMAARIYRPYDERFAQRCLEAAIRSYELLGRRPENHNADLSAFSTGGYGTRDPDDRMWAAAELWETTGEEVYLRDFEARARGLEEKIEVNWDWGSVGNLGMFTYILSGREGRDPELAAAVRRDLIATADRIVRTAETHGYARPLGERYYWGCNGTVARQTMNLTAANLVEPKPQYTAAALDAIHHLLGRNVFGRSFVTGLGHRPPMNPHSRRSGGDDVAAPWPGYLVGGAHPGAADWHDVEEDYRTNEIAINWNGALIYALAAFVQGEESK